MSNEQTVTLDKTQLDALLAKIASLEKSITVKQTIKNPNQVATLPVGKFDMKVAEYTNFIPIPRKDANGVVIVQTKGKFAGRPKANFRKQNRHAIVFTWPNGAVRVFYKTQDSPHVHDSGTPTVMKDEAFVANELKRYIGDDARAIKGAKWLMSVDEYATKPYGKLENATLKETIRGAFPRKVKVDRGTKVNPSPSVPLSGATAPF